MPPQVVTLRSRLRLDRQPGRLRGVGLGSRASQHLAGEHAPILIVMGGNPTSVEFVDGQSHKSHSVAPVVFCGRPAAARVNLRRACYGAAVENHSTPSTSHAAHHWSSVIGPSGSMPSLPITSSTLGTPG